MKPKVWFTGAGGQLGHALHTLSRNFLGFSRQDLELEGLTLKHCDALWGDLAPPDFFIHGAAWTQVDLAEREPERVFRINVSATECLARWCAHHGVHLVFLSTEYVFDGCHPPYGVHAAPNPLNVYGKSKALSEERVRAICPQHTIIRTSGLYSRTHHSFLKTVRAKLLEGSHVDVVADEWAQPTFALAFAGLLMEHLESTNFKSTQSTLHLAGPLSHSWYEAACLIESSLGLKDQVRPIKQTELSRLARRPRQASLLLHPSTRALPKLQQVLIETPHALVTSAAL